MHKILVICICQFRNKEKAWSRPMLGNHYKKNAPKCSTSSFVEYNAKVVWKSVKMFKYTGVYLT